MSRIAKVAKELSKVVKVLEEKGYSRTAKAISKNVNELKRLAWRPSVDEDIMNDQLDSMSDTREREIALDPAKKRALKMGIAKQESILAGKIDALKKLKADLYNLKQLAMSAADTIDFEDVVEEYEEKKSEIAAMLGASKGALISDDDVSYLDEDIA